MRWRDKQIGINLVNPADDIGLGYEWEKIEKILNEYLLIDSNKIICGECIGACDRYFDPGKMGSYFQY